MEKLTGLSPESVWAYFEEIIAIPRVSKKEEKIIAYLEAFAQKHQLSYRKDAVGNVLIAKGPTAGMENRKGIILQSHMDIVGEKRSDSPHDFDKDPIRPRLNGDWLSAEDTTLGADDGIGVAAALAILAASDLAHGPLECLFTVDEETGMTGAFGIQPGFMEGSIMLNLDSEDEGEVFIGCAGGIDTVATLKLRKIRARRNIVALRLSVRGLKGGHSGDEIDKGLGNAIKILNRCLWNADQRFRIRIAAMSGGKARNAIPRDAEAIITLPARHKELIEVFFSSFVASIRKELEDIEPGLEMGVEEVSLPDMVITRAQHKRLLNTLYACPSGVIAMSRDIPGLVETSTNLAAIRMPDADTMEIVTSQRSSVESAKRDIADRMEAIFSLLGAKVVHSDGYPGWKPNKQSEILGVSTKVYSGLFAKEPEVKAIHAGLECGLFLQKYPDLDMISIGPTVKGAHTPDERIEISTVQMFWDFLLGILKEAPKAE